MEKHQYYLQLLKTHVVPALGCTEPISVAYACALARETLGQVPERLDVVVSANLYKNAMGVFVPGTGMLGLHISAAAGAIAGNPNRGLEVLQDITPIQLEESKKMIAENIISVGINEHCQHVVYTEVTATANGHNTHIIIERDHTRVVYHSKDGEVLVDLRDAVARKFTSDSLKAEISIREIYDFATTVDCAEIAFMYEAYELNENLSKEGLRGDYGLQIGKTFAKDIEEGLLGEDLMNAVTMRTAAASDARMGGATLSAMTNYGSGNQGIVCTMPVVVTAEYLKVSKEQLVRALTLSHLLAIYIKSHMPKLSAFCGNTSSASAGAFAMTYLFGHDFDTCQKAMTNVLGDTEGMICDGAKAGCALKVSSSVAAAVKGVLMARRGMSLSKEQGIIAGNLEDTIDNVGKLVSEGFLNTDKVILDIMTHKKD